MERLTKAVEAYKEWQGSDWTGYEDWQGGDGSFSAISLNNIEHDYSFEYADYRRKKRWTPTRLPSSYRESQSYNGYIPKTKHTTFRLPSEQELSRYSDPRTSSTDRERIDHIRYEQLKAIVDPSTYGKALNSTEVEKMAPPGMVNGFLKHIYKIFDHNNWANPLKDEIAVTIDSGAELSVWPPKFFDSVPTYQTDASRKGSVYYGAGDTNGPTIKDAGSRDYTFQVGDAILEQTFHIADVRRPLAAMCEMCDQGWDCHFLSQGYSYAEHKNTGQRIKFVRRGGRYEMDVKLAQGVNEISLHNQYSALASTEEEDEEEFTCGYCGDGEQFLGCSLESCGQECIGAKRLISEYYPHLQSNNGHLNGPGRA